MSNSKKVDAIKVRMYRHGFGDCFLLSFLAQESRVFTMLIDCGLKKDTTGAAALIEGVVQDLRQELTPSGAAKPKLDVLVVTHEHWDHLSAFYPTKKQNHFEDFEVGQVWLAWTEDPDDEDAAKINSRLRKGTVALGIAAAKLAKVEKVEADQIARFNAAPTITEGRTLFNEQMNDVLGFYGTSLKETSESGIRFDPNGEISTTSQKALENVLEIGKRGKGAKYFSPGTVIDEALLPLGIKAYVLGPPRSSLINKSNPSKKQTQETYFGIEHGGLAGFIDGLLMMGTNDADPSLPDSSRPFKQGLGISIKEAEKEPFFQDHYYNGTDGHRRIENSWLNATGQFALQLDGAINNTSLVLAIELEASGKILLFPGDAQVGSWLSWHEHEWAQGSKKRTAKDLLKQTVLYKVSHHGSHNATVKEKGLEMMTHPDLVALIPEKQDSYNGIIYKPLLEQLKKRCKDRVIVSADEQYPPEALLAQKPNGLSEAEWTQLKSDLKVEKAYVEFTVRA